MTDNEVGGFGVAAANDLLFVTDFALVKQKVTCVSVCFEDESVADFFEDQVQAGRKPEQFARIWLHTHPGDSPLPSTTDEKTFERVFGKCDWSVMFILAQDSSTFAKLRFNVGPGGDIKIPVCVDYCCEFDGADFNSWRKQYKDNVQQDTTFLFQSEKPDKDPKADDTDSFGNEKTISDHQLTDEDLLSEIEQMDPAEREVFMDELAVRSNFWNEENEVFYG